MDYEKELEEIKRKIGEGRILGEQREEIRRLRVGGPPSLPEPQINFERAPVEDRLEVVKEEIREGKGLLEVFGESFISGFRGTVGSAVGGAGKLLGSEGLERAAEAISGDAAARPGLIEAIRKGEGIGEALAAGLGQGLGGTAALATAGLAAAPLGPIAAAGAIGLGSTLAAFDDMSEELKKRYGVEVPAWKILPAAIATGALDTAALGKVGGVILKPTPGFLGWLRDVVGAAGVEGGTEALQELVQRAAVTAEVKGERFISSETAERAAEAGLLGAVVGGGLGAVSPAVPEGTRDALARRLAYGGRFTSLEEIERAAKEEEGGAREEETTSPLEAGRAHSEVSAKVVLQAYRRAKRELEKAPGIKLEEEIGVAQSPLETVIVARPEELKEGSVFPAYQAWEVPDVLLRERMEDFELFSVRSYKRVMPALDQLREGMLVGDERVVREILEAAELKDKALAAKLFASSDVTASPETLEDIRIGVLRPGFVAEPTVRFLPGLSPKALGLVPEGDQEDSLQRYRYLPSEILEDEETLRAALEEPKRIADAIERGALSMGDFLRLWVPVTERGREIFARLQSGAGPEELRAGGKRGDFALKERTEAAARVLADSLAPMSLDASDDYTAVNVDSGAGLRSKIRGTTVRPSAPPPEKPGVILTSSNIKGKRRDLIVRLAEKLHETFKLRYNVLLRIEAGPPVKYRGFWHFSHRNNAHIISVVDGDVTDMSEVIIHEMIHALTGERLLEGNDPLLARFLNQFMRQWVGARIRGRYPQNFIMKVPYGTIEWYNFSEFLATHGTVAFLDHLKSTLGDVASEVGRSVEREVKELDRYAWTSKFDKGLAAEIRAAMEDLIEHPARLVGEVAGHSFKAHAEFAKESGLRTEAPVAFSPFPKAPESVNRDVVHWGWYMDLGWTLVQIAQANPEVKNLQDYVSRVRALQRDKVAEVLDADEILRDWRRLPNEMAEALGEALYRYGAGDSAALEGLPTPAKRIGSRVIAYLRRSLDKLENILEEKLMAELEDPTEAVRSLRAEFQRMRQEPYFPFLRFGKYSVTVRDHISREVLAFYLFESERERAEELEDIKKDFSGALVDIELGKLPEVMKSFIGVSPFVLKKVVGRLKLTPEQEKELDKILATQFPTESARNRFLRKKKTKGFSTDAVRTFASYALRMSNYLAILKHGDALRENISGVVRESRAVQVNRGERIVDTTSARKLADWMSEHLDYLLQPANEWVGLRTFAFLYHLGFNPASAFINLTQPAMVTFPWLARIFGDRVAVKAMFYALKNVKKAFTGGLRLDEMRAIDILSQQGLLDQSLVHELAGIAAGDFSNRYLGKKGQTFLTRFAEAASFLFHNAERINRRLVVLAAMEAARIGKPKDPEFVNRLIGRYRGLWEEFVRRGMAEVDGALAAVAALDETMFDYSAYNRPKYMRGRKSALFVFMTFVQHMLWAARYMPGRGRMLLILGAAAGLLGLPGAEDADDLVEALSSLMGMRVRPSEELSKLLAEVLDDPDIVLHGLGYGLGDLMALLTGMPGPDISSSLSMGRIVPGLRGLLSITKGDVEEGVSRAAEDVSGAGFSVMWRLLRAVFDPHPLTMRNVEQVAPTALRNLMMATRWLVDGKEVDASGAPIVRFDPSDRASILLMALGLRPAKLTEAVRERRLTQEAIRYWQGRREALMRAFFWAELPEERSLVLSKIAEFNREAPPGFPISIAQLRRSFKERTRRAYLQERFGVGTKSLIPFVLTRREDLGATE